MCFRSRSTICGTPLVAISYGAVLIFFVGFMGSFTVYLSKWAVSQTPLIKYSDRDPVYLFIYAPDSFHWRNLMLKDKLIDGDPLVQNGHINEDAYDRYTGSNGKKMANEKQQLWLPNKIGAGMVAFWLGLVFLLMIGFGYSLFWSLMTIIYFLLRRDVDAAEMDEVYLEEDEHDLAYSGPLTPPTSPPPTAPSKAGQQPLAMVDAPAPNNRAAAEYGTAPTPDTAGARRRPRNPRNRRRRTGTRRRRVDTVDAASA